MSQEKSYIRQGVYGILRSKKNGDICLVRSHGENTTNSLLEDNFGKTESIPLTFIRELTVVDPQLAQLIMQHLGSGAQSEQMRFKQSWYENLSGSVEAEEATEQALIREISEEVSLDLSPKNLVNTIEPAFGGIIQHRPTGKFYFDSIKGFTVLVDEEQIKKLSEEFDVLRIAIVSFNFKLVEKLLKENSIRPFTLYLLVTLLLQPDTLRDLEGGLTTNE